MQISLNKSIFCLIFYTNFQVYMETILLLLHLKLSVHTTYGLDVLS